ncbi:MAG: hypothetical protein LLG06_02435 [Desulfobacteraceae bacterium]|nr:hypothetical protein [Desulfobacteraceae bacterium]
MGFKSGHKRAWGACSPHPTRRCAAHFGVCGGAVGQAANAIAFGQTRMRVWPNLREAGEIVVPALFH